MEVCVCVCATLIHQRQPKLSLTDGHCSRDCLSVCLPVCHLKLKLFGKVQNE